jgi:hypothetical protein
VAIRAADPRLSVRVGAGMLVVLALAFVWLLFLRDRLFLAPSVKVHVYFRHAGALKEGSAVIVAGREVGRIDAIRLVTKHESRREGHPLAGDEGIVAIARITKKYRARVPENGDFFVASKGLLSERYLEVGPPLDGSEPGKAAWTGMEVLGSDPPTMDRVWTNTWENIQIARAFMADVEPEARRFMATLRELSATLDLVEPAPGAYAELADRIDRATTEARTTWLAMEAGRITPGEIDALITRARRTGAQIAIATRLFRMRLAALSKDLGRVQAQIDVAAPDLSRKLRAAIAAADGALAKIEQVQVKVDDLLAMIDRGEGTIGRLANDPEFPEDAKALGKILKRQPWRIFDHPKDAP